MYVQGVSSKSFKQNAAGAMVPPINQQKPQYPLLLAISTKLGPKIVTGSFLTKTIKGESSKKQIFYGQADIHSREWRPPRGWEKKGESIFQYSSADPTNAGGKKSSFFCNLRQKAD